MGGGRHVTLAFAVVAAATGALVATAILLALVVAFRAQMGLWLLQRLVGRLLRFITNKAYPDNLFGALNLSRHLGLQNLVETMMRANQGTVFRRPWGSPRGISPWEQLMFQPVYLRPRLPTPNDVQIATGVTIGPLAERPLQLKIPILIAGMAFGGAITTEVKVAWAKGANLAGTAINSGETYLPAERAAAERLIVQYSRGLWSHSTMNDPSPLGKADAIEVQLGQGAEASAPIATAPQFVSGRMRSVLGLDPGEAEKVSSRLRKVDTPRDFVRLVRDLKARYPVPVGVKVGAGDHLELDLDVFLEAGVDFVTVDGADGGSHGSPTTISDDVGLPTLHAVCRADRYLRACGLRDRVTLIAAGQLTTPGRCLKALALGADVAGVGTAPAIALFADQAARMPVLHPGRPAWTWQLDPDLAAQKVANYLASCMQDIEYVVRVLGKTSVAAVGREDLVALSRDVAEIAGVRLAWERPVADMLKDIVYAVDETMPAREERIH